MPAPFDLAIVGGAKADPSAISTSPISSLEIGSNSWLTFTQSQSLSTTPKTLTLTVSGNATVQAGGGIILDGLGYAGGQGTGHGQTLYNSSLPFGQTGTGGGYGGAGGASAFGGTGGSSHDSFSNPAQPGSGGGNGAGSTTNALGGAGGGALQMRVVGRLVLEGIISADGNSGVGQGSGGGSGGSIRLTVGSLSGRGLISADGGSGDLPYGGGGAGGRIALLSIKGTTPFADFEGNLRARGGAGANYGGAGTIFLQPASPSPQELVIDNGGRQGGSTTLSLPSVSAGLLDLTVRGAAAVSLPSGSVIAPIGNLQVGSNSWLICSGIDAALALTVTSNATIQAGGSISLDGQGGSLGKGAGAGGYSFGYPYSAGGGGYGGAGGSGSNGAAGGRAYGSTAAPVDAGSGGGRTLAPVYELG